MSTTILLDGRPLNCPDSTLAGAVSAAREAAGSRLIVEIRADGVLVDPDALGAHQGAIARIEMLSADPGALARCTLHDASDALEEIITVQSDAAGLLQTGETERAMAMLQRILAVWGSVAQSVELIDQMHLLDTGDAPSTLSQTPPDYTGFNACLRSVREALAGEDHAALADLLAYDLRELAQRWVADLRRRAEAGPETIVRAGSPARAAQ